MSSATQPSGYEYSAIQNIFASMGLAGRDGCDQRGSHPGGQRLLSTMALIRALSPRSRATHIPRLKHPRALALIIHLVPVPQSNKSAASDVLLSAPVYPLPLARRTLVFQKSKLRRTTTSTVERTKLSVTEVSTRPYTQLSRLRVYSQNPHSTYTAIAAERKKYSATNAPGCEEDLRMPDWC